MLACDHHAVRAVPCGVRARYTGTINALMASIGGTVVGYSVLSLAMIKVSAGPSPMLQSRCGSAECVRILR